jgi:hypothetical protein
MLSECKALVKLIFYRLLRSFSSVDNRRQKTKQGWNGSMAAPALLKMLLF